MRRQRENRKRYREGKRDWVEILKGRENRKRYREGERKGRESKEEEI